MTERLTHRDVLIKSLSVEFKDYECPCAATDDGRDLYGTFQRTVKRFGFDPAPAVPAKAQDPARRLDRAAADDLYAAFQRTVRRSRFLFSDPPLADPLPVPQREALERLLTWGAKQLRMDEPDALLYRRDPEDERLGFYRPDEPGRIWVAAEEGRPEGPATRRTGEDISLTALHELAHASGVRDEPEAERIASELARQWAG